MVAREPRVLAWLRYIETLKTGTSGVVATLRDVGPRQYKMTRGTV